MKNILTILAISMIGTLSSWAATSTIVLNAGDITDINGSPLAPNSLLLLIAAGTDGTFYNMLSAGQFVGGDDVLLGAQAANNNNGSIQATSNVFTFDSLTAGQAVEILWFSDFTLAQYQAGATPTVGNHYGVFAGQTTGTPNGGSVWAVPSAGSTTNLNFVTRSANTNLNLGLTDAYANSAGEAVLEVTVAVPEPSEYAMCVAGLLVLVVLVRRSGSRLI